LRIVKMGMMERDKSQYFLRSIWTRVEGFAFRDFSPGYKGTDQTTGAKIGFSRRG
jgi:hypothetical protein